MSTFEKDLATFGAGDIAFTSEFPEAGARVAYDEAVSLLSKTGVEDPLRPGAFVFQCEAEVVRVAVRVLAFPRSIIIESKGDFTTLFPQQRMAMRTVVGECRVRVQKFLTRLGVET